MRLILFPSGSRSELERDCLDRLLKQF